VISAVIKPAKPGHYIAIARPCFRVGCCGSWAEGDNGMSRQQSSQVRSTGKQLVSHAGIFAAKSPLTLKPGDTLHLVCFDVLMMTNER